MNTIKLSGNFGPVPHVSKLSGLHVADPAPALQELHTTGDFTNSYGETCRVSMELDVISGTEHNYNVRTSKRTIASNGSKTIVTSEETVETFYSRKSAAREYNWSLYVLAASEHDSAIHKLDTAGAVRSLVVQQTPINTMNHG